MFCRDSLVASKRRYISGCCLSPPKIFLVETSDSQKYVCYPGRDKTWSRPWGRPWPTGGVGHGLPVVNKVKK